MLNPLPVLLTFSFYAPLILRIASGVVWMQFGKQRMQKSNTWFERISGGLLAIAGLMLLLGFLTQIASIVSLIGAITYLIISQKNGCDEKMFAYYFLLAAISLALLSLGAGGFAFDLPL